MRGIGYCITCDKPLLENGRLTNEYTEVEVQWSNKSRMKVAVCKNCAVTGAWDTAEGKKQVTDWHWHFWEKAGAMLNKEVTIV